MPNIAPPRQPSRGEAEDGALDRGNQLAMPVEDINSSVVVDVDVELTTSSTHSSLTNAKVPSLSAMPAAGGGDSVSSQRSARGSARRLSARLIATPRALARSAMNIINESADAVLDIIDGPPPPESVTVSDEKIDDVIAQVMADRAARASARGGALQELEA